MVDFQTKQVDTDILIIGGGMAGCGAAVEASYWAKKNNLKVTLVEKAAIERSGGVAMGLSAINTYLGVDKGENTPEDFVRYVRNDQMGTVREDLVYDIGRHVDSSVKLFEKWGLPLWKDENGNYVKFWPLDLKKDLILDKINNLNEIYKLEKYGLFFNMSSINVRKECLLPYLDYLYKTNSNVDDFIFFSTSNQNNSKIILSSRKLTLYTVHKSTTVFIYNNIDEFVEKYVKNEKFRYNTYLILFDLLNKHNGNKIFKAFIKYKIILSKINLYFLDSKNIDNLKLKDFLYYLYFSFVIKDLYIKKDF
ncbi:FAD-dependent oxidoreductase, partial [Desulfurella sp.]|uniref:FAD-dependent oxidoreductase n=1 Tax=Desulfurella sp. TaxID=1962857 RepID=UPI0025C00125